MSRSNTRTFTPTIPGSGTSVVHKPLALVTALMLLVSLVALAGAPKAHAAAWTTDAAGVDTVRAGKATDPNTRGDVVSTSTTTPTIPVPAIDPNGLYSIDDGGWATVYKVSTSTGSSTGLFRVHGSAGTYNSTMAVDSGVNGRRSGFYTWYWGNADGYEGAPATTMPVYFWEAGKNHASDIYYVPRPRYFSHNIGNAYFSGGVLNQKTGMLYMSPGECDSIGGTARFQIFDPATLTTYWSGEVTPATASDDLWNGRANSCGYAGYISSGAAILPNGDFVVIVNGTGKALSASDPVNTTGKAIAAGTTANVAFMVSIHPSMDNRPWTYSVMKMITSPPSGNVANFFGAHHWGTAFSNGYLYVVTNGYLHEVNPLTGYIKQVGTTGSTMFDLGSSQTAAAITGRVLDDSDASGDYDPDDAGVEGVTIAIYQSGGRNNYAQPTLLGTTTTSGSGQYTFIVPDSDPTGNAKYYVRMVQPSINNVAAVTTAGAVISDTEAGASNDAQLTCIDGNTYVGDAAGTTIGGPCSNVRADGTSTGADLEALGTVGDPATWGPYGLVVMRNTWSESTVDFTISTAMTSYGDAAAGPDDATAPVHNNSSGATLWLGDAQGAYPAPATDGSAHDNTDDGMYIDSYTGKVPLQGTVLAGSKTYALAADVSGSLAGSAKVAGWVTGAGNNTWQTSAKWAPTVANNVARGDFQFQSGPISGSPTVQMRVNASTVAASQPTNANQEYQGTTNAWTTPGEIEDYSFTVQDSVYRPAAATTGPTGTFTIGGKAITAAAKPVVGPAVGAAATQPVTLKASAPNNSWTLVGVQVKDTVTGAVKHTPTPATTGLDSTVTWTPALGDDVTVEFTYTKAPDPAKSSLTVDRNQAPVGEFVTATAEVLDADSNPLPGVEVSFANQSAPTTTLSAGKCTTGLDGKCQVTITTTTAGTYPGELSATVVVDKQVLHVSGSPRDLAFVAVKPDPTKSSLSFTPPGPLTVGDQAANTYTFTALVLDANNNRVPGQTVSFAVTRDDGTSVNAAATHLSASTCATGDGTAGTTGACAVTMWSLEAGTYKVQAQITDPVTGLPAGLGAGSPATVTFNPAAPAPGPFTCDDGHGGRKPGSSITAAPGTLPVGDNSSITAYVTDQYCNPVPGAAVVFAIHPSGTAIIGTASATTGSDGKAHSTLTDTTAETVNVGATASLNSQAVAVDTPKPVKFEVGGFSWTTSTFTVSPQVSATDPLKTGWPEADGNDAYTVTLTARDAQNNLLTGLDTAKMAFTPSTTNITVSAVQEMTAGVYQVTLTSQTASTTPTVSVAYDSQGVKNPAGGTASPIPFRPGPVDPTPGTCPNGRTRSSLTVSPTDLPVGASATVTAYVTDKNCNPIDNELVTFTVDGSATIAPASKLTGVDGLALAAATDNVAETVSVVAKVQVNGVLTTIDGPKAVRFTASAFSWDKSSFAVSPVVSPTDAGQTNWPVANGSESYTVTLTAQDANGNPLTGLDTKLMVFSVSSPDLKMSAVSEQPGGKYVATVTSKVASDTPTVSVSYNTQPVKSLVGQTSLPTPFKAGPPQPGPVTCPGRNGTSLTVNPALLPVGNASTVTALVTDQDCNGIKGASVTFAADGASSFAAAGQVGPQQITATTDATGQVSVTLTDAKAETVTVSATAVVATTTVMVDNPKTARFTAGSADPAKSHVTVAPGTQKAGNPVIVTVTVRDSGDNPVDNLTVADFLLNGVAAGLPDLVFTDFAPKPDGVYTFKTTSQDMGRFTVRAIAQSILLDDAPTVEFTPGDICVTGCSTDPNRQTRIRMTLNDQLADGVAKDRARAYAFDAYGNPVAGAVFTVTASPQSGALAPSTQVVTTAVDGTATVEWSSLTAGDFTALTTVMSGSMQVGVDVGNSDLSSIRFTAGQVSAAKSTLVVAPTTSQLVGSSFTATAKVTDANGNPLSGETVTFSVSSPKAVLSSMTCQTLSSGTCSVSVTSKLADDYQVAATVAQAGQATAVTGSPQTVSFHASTTVCVDGVDVCDPVDDPTTPEDESVTHRTRVEVDPDNAVDDGLDRDTIVVYAYDAYGNPVKQAPVQIRTTDAMLTLLSTSATTGADGTARFDATSTVAGGHLATAVVGGKTPSGSPATLNFTTGAIDSVTLSISPAAALPVGSNFTLTALVADSTGNGLDKAVVFFALPAGVTTPAGQSVTTCTTAAAGECSIQATSTRAGTYSFEARVNSVVSNVVSGQFTAGAASAVNSFATVSHDGEAFDGLARDIVTVTALDQYGNLVAGVAVSSTPVAGQSSGLTVQTNVAPTGPDGTTTIWYSSTQAGAKRADVRLNGALVPQGSPVTVSFGNGTGDPDHSGWTLTPATPLTVGNGTGSQFTAEATVRDAFDAPVAGAVVRFGADRDGTSWGKAKQSCVTDAQGRCSIVVASTVAGTFGVTAALPAGQIDQAKTAVWVPDAACALCSDLQVTWDDAVADGDDVDIVTVTVRDQYDNPVPGQLVSSVAGDAYLKVGTGIPFTDAAGQTVIKYTSLKAGPHTATVGIGLAGSAPIGSPVTLNFTAGPVEAGPIVCSDGKGGTIPGTNLAVAPTTLAVGNSAVATALVTDKRCNPVPGVAVTFASNGSSLVAPVTVVTGADGKAIAQVSDTVAETVDVAASFPLNGAPAKVDDPKQVTFTASKPSIKPTHCPPGKVGTNLSVAPTDVAIPGGAVATAYLTDDYCNPVGSALIGFTVTGNGRLSTASVLTDAAGLAVADVTDPTPETVFVTAMYGTAAIPGSPAPVRFLDTTAPGAPTITSPGNGTWSNSDPLVVAGVGEPGSTVVVTDSNGAVACQTQVGAGGAWTCPASLADGDHTLTAAQTDPSGNQSAPSAPVKVSVDTRAPSVSISRADQSAISGTSEPGATVAVSYPKSDGTHGTVNVPVKADGTWSMPTPSTAVSGLVQAVATDPAGNQSNMDSKFIDLDAPGSPTINQANEHGISGAADPATSQPGDSVLVSDKNGNVLCSTTVQPDMSWSCSLPQSAGNGGSDGPVSAVVIDNAGNVSAPGTAVLDTQAPNAPQVDHPLPGQSVNDPTPTVSGTGEPGAAVSVAAPDGTELCTAVVRPDGTWACSVGGQLPDGPATLVVAQTDPAGNTSDPTVTTVVVDTIAPSEPVVEVANGTQISGTLPGPVDGGTIITVTDQAGNELCVATVAADGKWLCLTPGSVGGDTVITVVATDPAGNNSGPVTVPLDVTPPGKPTIDVANGTEVVGTVPGVVDPGTQVVITWPNGDISKVPVNPDGSWSVTTPGGMADGKITVVATDPAGNESAKATTDLDTTPPGKPTIDTANGTEVTGSVPGDVDPGTEIVVTFPDGSTQVVPVNPDGSWRADTPPGVGSGTVTVVAKDPSGNVSAEVTTHLDADAPTSPVVNPSNGSEVSGSAEPGGTVTVTDESGNPVPGCAQVSVSGTGAFSCHPTKPLQPGDTINVVVKDKAGNASPPAVVTIGRLGITVAHPSRYSQETQVVTGTSFNAGEKVCLVVRSTPVEVGCARADDQGKVTISFVVPDALEAGNHEVELKGDQSGSVKSAFTVNVRVPTGGTVVPNQGATVLAGLLATLTAAVAGLRPVALRYVALRRRSTKEV